MSLAAFTFTDQYRPVVEIGVGDSRVDAGQARFNVARFDTPEARFAGNEPTWLDVACHVQEVQTELGRDRVLDRFRVGECRIIVDNETGWADSFAEPSGVLSMRPGRPVRVGVERTQTGEVRWLFRGFIDAMDPVYEPEQPDETVFRCIDALGEANRVKFPGFASPLGAGDTASERVARILDYARWPTAKRVIQTSSTEVVADDLGGQVADLLGQTVDSDGGAIYGDHEGRIVYRYRDWQSYSSTAPPDGVIGNVEPGDVCPTGWVRPWRREDVATRVLLGRKGSPSTVRPKVYDDEAGFPFYGIEPFERLDLLCRFDADLDRLGARHLATRGSQTAPRIRSVTLDAGTSPEAADLMAEADPFKPSRYLCRHKRPNGAGQHPAPPPPTLYSTDAVLVEDDPGLFEVTGGPVLVEHEPGLFTIDGARVVADGTLPPGVVFSLEHFVTGIRHTLRPHEWTAAIDLDRSDPWISDAGRFDVDLWDRATFN